MRSYLQLDVKTIKMADIVRYYILHRAQNWPTAKAEQPIRDDQIDIVSSAILHWIVSLFAVSTQNFRKVRRIVFAGI